ncbi:putative inorganic phosphate cotransporter [Pieris napi]|uniref:putative inorganic phosphate cotransporter n=1 Tax=Pieris napi TaxID=78633 RepID=UPI001FB9A5AF|nr:putative inorganic phosphate cotransporter [Pieris napi]
MEKADLKKEKLEYGIGIRHLQMFCMGLNMITLFIVRSSMGVAVLAMTDISRRRDSKVEIYDWDKKTQGLILSSFFWGYMVMQIPAGLLSKKFGGKLVILVALVVNGFVCGLLPSIVSIGGWQIVCVCRMLMGLTQACLFPASHTLLGKWLPAHERTSYTGLVYGGCQLGIVIAMPVSGLLAATDLGWKLIFYGISALMFVEAFIWHFFAASSPGEHRLITYKEREYIESDLNSGGPSNLRTPWLNILKTRGFWGTLAGHIGSSVVYMLFFVDMPTYLEKGLQISLTSSAFLSALPYIGMVVGNVVSSFLCEKMYNKGVFRLVTLRRLFNSIGVAGVTVGLLALSFAKSDSKTLAVGMLTVTLSLCGFVSAGFMMSHLDLSPNYGGVMLSVTNCITSAGAVAIPITNSFILRNDPTDVGRWRVVFFGTAVVGVVCNVLYVLLVSADRQEWDDPNYLDKQKADPEERQPALNSKEFEMKQLERR